jgi:hypothetical protein
MQVRGNIGEEVYLKAKIKEIHILDTEDIQYTLEVDKIYNISADETNHQLTTADILRNVPESRIKFKLKPTDIVNNKITEENKKGPGRPKKVTVDTMMNKIKENKNKDEVKENEGNQVVQS